MRSIDAKGAAAMVAVDGIGAADGVNTGRVLVVEIPPAPVRDLKQTLIPSGTDITVVKGLDEAIEHAKHTSPDVLLLASIPPDPEGTSILTRLRASSGLRHVPFVVILPIERISALRTQWLDIAPIACIRSPLETNTLIP